MSDNPRTVRRTIASLLLLMVAFAGCGGPERVAVSGKVSFDGGPLEQGTISFVPEAGTQAPTVGGEITGGSYTIPAEDGPVPGNYRVEIGSVQKTGRQVEAGTPAPPGTMVDEVKQIIPARYNTDSDLTAVILPGPNEDVDFELESGEESR